MFDSVLVGLLHGCRTRFGSQAQAFAIEALHDVRKVAYDSRSPTLETADLSTVLRAKPYRQSNSQDGPQPGRYCLTVSLQKPSW